MRIVEIMKVGESLLNIGYSKGPSIIPYGTPEVAKYR